MRIVLSNPETTNQAIAFLLDGQPCSLDPGQSEEFSVSQPMLVQFHRGGAYGPASYSLSEEGVYEFIMTERGWDLVRKSFRVTLDNTVGAGDFQCIVDGIPVVIPASATHAHRSRFPVVVAFDQGNGGEPAQVVLATGTYAIAINPETNLRELSPVSQAPRGDGATVGSPSTQGQHQLPVTPATD